jgi:hypothetical protein
MTASRAAANGKWALSCVNDLGQFLGLLIMQRLLRREIQ